jgi:hypothetical protein
MKFSQQGHRRLRGAVPVWSACHNSLTTLEGTLWRKEPMLAVRPLQEGHHQKTPGDASILRNSTRHVGQKNTGHIPSQRAGPPRENGRQSSSTSNFFW